MKYGSGLRYSALLCIIICFLLSCAPRANRWGLPQHEYSYRVPQKVDDGWQTAALHEEAIDPGKINELMENILNKRFKNIHSVLLVKNGKLVLEEYFYGYQRDTKHELHSVSKSITSILVGIAIDQRRISGVDEKVYKFFPEYRGTRWIDQKYDIALEHVLTMSAGIDWDEQSTRLTDRRNDIVAALYSDNWLEYVLNKEQVEVPGTRFNYSGGLNLLLGGIIRNTSDLYADQFAEKYLFGPLGISDYRWGRHPDGTINTQGGLSLRPRDMAKIGYLFLKHGQWQGRQIVSNDWVEASTKTHIPTYMGLGYGYQWYRGQATINRKVFETFFAWGRGGQFIFVIPVFDLVAVFTSRPYDNSMGVLLPLGIVPNYIIPAMLPPAPAQEIIQIDPTIIEKYQGEYEFKPWNTKLSIIKESNKIYLTDFHGGKVVLSALAATRFQGTMKVFGDVTIDFYKDKKKDVKRLVLNYGFLHLNFDKIN
jgi:CubicO group peptidase (beta-lactamase class C family)